MKQTKILALVLALAMLFTFAACAKEETQKTAPQTTEATVETTAAAVETEPAVEKGEATVLIATDNETKTVKIKLADLKEDATMLDAFKSDAYKDVFKADLSEGEFVMLNALEGLAPDAAKNEYIAVYSTDTNFVDVDSEYTLTEEIDGVTYYTTSVGVAEIVLADGESYLFQIASF